MTVTDKVEGWNEKEWAGSRFVACMWIYTNAVMCDGQEPTQEEMMRNLSTIMESASWVCEDALRDNEWVTEHNVILKENENLEALNYDLDVPCVIQWGLLWFSSPSRLKQTFTNNGTEVAKYHEAVNMAIEATFTTPFEGLHTPRTCLLRSVRVVLYISPDSLFATMTGTTIFLMREDATVVS